MAAHAPDTEADAIEAELDRLAGGRGALLGALGGVVADAVAYVLDGAASLDELEACEKAFVGVKFEKRAIRLLGLPEKRRNPSQRLDTVVAGLDVDLKFTLGRTWMIPPEVVGAWCLLAALDHPARSYSVGLLKVTEDALTRGANRDAKRSVGRTGMGRIRWLGRGVRLPDA